MKNLNLFLRRNGKINVRLIVLSIGIFTMMISGIGGILFYFGLIYLNDPDRQQFSIRGIDISSHQNQIDWSRLSQSQLSFVLIKATEGGNFKDPMFKHNWQNAKQIGTIVGAYHFFTFCKSGREQAKNYIETVPQLERGLPPVIDLEFSGNCQSQPTPAALEKELNTFIKIVENKYHKKPILYVTYEFYDRYLRDRFGLVIAIASINYQLYQIVSLGYFGSIANVAESQEFLR
jgi:lysozyme